MGRPATVRVIHRARRRSDLLALSLLTLFLLLPAVASGHAELIAIDPLDGERLEMPPSAVTLTFSEPVGLAPGGLRVVSAGGDEVDDGPELVDGRVVTQPLASLGDGWFVAIWGIVSEDGHIIRSASTFAVGDAALEARPEGQPIGVPFLFAALRAFTDMAGLVAAGAWAAWWLLGARVRTVRRDRRVTQPARGRRREPAIGRACSWAASAG